MVRVRSPIALLTDFGQRDHYVGVMKGVIATIAPGAAVVDITHGVPAQSVAAGAIVLRQSWRYFPPGTIFVAVVDPGVGSARRALAIGTRARRIFVGPDNGLLHGAAEEAGISEAVELRAARYRLSGVSSTFHGRDIFAPAAAHLWRGVKLSLLGPRVGQIERCSLAWARGTGQTLSGEVIYVDSFGNLITNIDRETLKRFAARFRAGRLWVTIGGRESPLAIVETYASVPTGSPGAIFGSFETIEVAVRDGNAARRLRAQVGTPVQVHAAQS
jgi:S-adenosylmethionine hydrolase